MIDHLRTLLYPLGSLAFPIFGARTLIQWYRSEKEGQSVTQPLFWRLSMTANSLLAIHATIQLQFWVALVQSCQLVLAWRNLNLFKPTAKQVAFTTVVLMLTAAIFSVLALFIAQGLFLNAGEIVWMRVPQSLGPHIAIAEVSSLTHAFGIVGICAYSLRFWIQWLQSEYQKRSELTAAFWWMSLAGAILSGLYFIRIFDWVNALGIIPGVVPYIRNLYLIKNGRKKQQPTIFLFAGEISADSYGAHIVEKLRKALPHYRLIGVGGPAMAQAGFASMLPFSLFQVMGFFDVYKRLLLLLYASRRIVRTICRENPKVVLFIDNPAFSLHIAKKLRKRGYTGKLVQCVAPTVWAWKKGRAAKMAALFDHLFCILPFEPPYFSHLMSCSFIGHPILETMEEAEPATLITPRLNKPLIALFPGSRPKEVARNLPKQFEAIARLQRSGVDCAVGCVMSPSANPWQMKKTINAIKQQYAIDLCVELVPFSKRYALMKECSCALAKSGTVTLELALHQVPTVVTYALPWFDLQIAKYLKLDLPFYCIVNILAKGELFPELIKPPVAIDDISRALAALLADKTRQEQCKAGCAQIAQQIYTGKQPSELIVEKLCALEKM